MREVIAAKLWTGNAAEARDLKLLSQLGISAVVDLALEEPPAFLQREVAYVRCPIDDSEAATAVLVEVAVRTVEHLVRLRVPTLVACSAGLSRSPLITAAAIARSDRMPLEAAIQSVSDRGPTDVSPGLLSLVRQVVERLDT